MDKNIVDDFCQEYLKKFPRPKVTKKEMVELLSYNDDSKYTGTDKDPPYFSQNELLPLSQDTAQQISLFCVRLKNVKKV